MGIIVELVEKVRRMMGRGAAQGPRDGRGLGPRDGRGGRCPGRKKLPPEEVEVEEAKKEKEYWIKGAIKKPGAFRKEMGVEPGEKIPKKKITGTIKKLQKKGAGEKKLSKKERRTLRRAVLARTLSGLGKSESSEIADFLPVLEEIRNHLEESCGAMHKKKRKKSKK